MALVIALFCLYFAVIELNIYLALLGGYIAIRSIGTLKHIHTGEYDKDSSLPKDINIK